MGRFVSRMKGKLRLLFYIVVLCFFVLGYKVVFLQAFQREKFKELAEYQHTAKIEIHALRGSILDRNGKPLAKSLTLPSIAANPAAIDNKEETAEKLSALLGMKRDDIYRSLSCKSSFIWIDRKVDEKLAEKVDSLKLKGIFQVKEATGKRFYPKGKLAVHVLGTTGIDDQGLDGVEAVYDKTLTGRPGYLEAETDKFGRAIPDGAYKLINVKEGKSLELTIDETIQYVAERELAKAVKQYNAKAGTCIVMDVKTGDILAMVNKPDYPAGQYLKSSPTVLANRSITDAYEPGSTFKVFLAAAAIDSGKITLKDRFYCGNCLKAGGWSIHNANDGLSSESGTEDITDIVTYSYNVGAASVGLKVGKTTFHNYISKFGFGEETGIDLPQESTGIVMPVSDWSAVNLATASFGQGIAVTPIQLVTAMAAIANDGVMMKPRVVKAILDEKGNVVKEIKPREARRVISVRSAYTMKNILCQVVEKGTGKRAKVPGYFVAGKTGTAQIVHNGVYESDRYVASFLGFAPANNPRIAILIKVEEPKGAIWGGVVAAPVFAEVAREALWYLKVPPGLPEDE